MAKLVVALRASTERADPAALLADAVAHRWRDGARRAVVDAAQPGQTLLVAAGLRYDGRPHVDAVAWLHTSAPSPAPPWRDLAEDLAHDLAGVGHCSVADLDEHPGWDDTGDATPLGPGALKMVSFVVGRSDGSAGDFERHYLEHVPVAREHHPGVCRYVQNLVRASTASGPLDPDVAAVSELWYASAEDFLDRFYRSAESPAAVKADNEEYIDFARTRSVLLLPG